MSLADCDFLTYQFIRYFLKAQFSIRNSYRPYSNAPFQLACSNVITIIIIFCCPKTTKFLKSVCCARRCRLLVFCEKKLLNFIWFAFQKFLQLFNKMNKKDSKLEKNITIVCKMLLTFYTIGYNCWDDAWRRRTCVCLAACLIIWQLY